MRITVDTRTCIGSGRCALAVPDVFDQDDDGLVVLLDDRPAAALHPDVHDAVAQCPVRALTTTDR